MDFRTKRVLIITPFYMLFEFFLLKYIFLLVGGLENFYLLLFTIFIGIIHCIPMFFESKKSRVLTRVLSILDGVWMWASVMFLMDIVLIYLMSMAIRLSWFINLTLLSIVPILGVYNYYKAHKIIIKEKTIYLNNLKTNINIAHLSDVHFGSVRHKKIIGDISNKLKQIENDCDIAIISGDLADGSSIVLKDDFEAFGEVRIPVIFTPGNHDFYPGIDEVLNASRNAGLIVLDNDNFEFNGLNIYGLTFSFEDKHNCRIDNSVIKPDLVNILNYHVPYNFDEFSKLGFDIQLSGHTHGGQFYPIVWFSKLIFKYNKGLFKNSFGRYLHVTTGVGSMDTPMRWGTDSEIVILKLRKSDF